VRVIGPEGWESTQRLREALAEVESDRVFRFGAEKRLDGFDQLEIFTANNISCPSFTKDRDEALYWLSEGKRVWGRRFIHTHGRDIVSYNLRQRWLRSDFWVQPLPSTHEYRQHIFDGRAIRLGEKILVEEPWRSLQVRSRANGWHIAYPPQTTPPEGLRSLAKQAVAACGYLYGAVDILVDRPSGGMWILEVNSAPSLRDSQTLNAYVSAICKWIRK